MFVAIAGAEGAAASPGFDMMVQALQGTLAPARTWRDPEQATGLAGVANGILPEDRFDRQPCRIGDLSVVSVARLDNRADLLARLGIDGANAREIADNEIVARACSRWGEEAPLHLYGDWAFVAWNTADRCLLAAVNHLGTVPIFFHQAGETLYLSSQLAALMAHPAVPAELDPRRLAVYLAPRRQLGATMFRGLGHVEGGTLMRWRDGAIEVRRWWQPDTEAQPRFRRERDYVDEAMALFDDAVAQRMRTTGELAAALSGGLDSSLVAATAARRLAASGRGIDVFTSVPQVGLAVEQRALWDADDFPFAAATARLHPNMTHHAVEPDGVIPPDLAPDTHRRVRNPLGNTANHVWYRHIGDRACSMGVRVILGGEHGNVSLTVGGGFGPEDRFKFARYRYLLDQLRFRATPRSLMHRAGALRGRREPQLPAGNMRIGAPFIAPGYRDQLANELQRSTNLEPRAAFVRAATRPYAGAGGDFMASFGCEWRDPMNDRRMIETLVTYPYSAFRAGGRARGLARQVARGRLPDSVRLRYSRGAQAPDAAAWFMPNAARYRAVFNAMRSSPLCRELIDMAHLQKTLDALCAGDLTQDHHSTHRSLDVGQLIIAWEAGGW